MYKTSLANLKNLNMDINDTFLTQESVDVPLLRGINFLLNSIDEKGLKLTQKGFLPTKIVKEIVKIAHTKADERFLNVQSRYYEEENLSANMARVVAESLKLIKVQKGKLLLTKKAVEFLFLAPPKQYIILLNIMLGINIGYFDRHQEALCVHNSSLILLQLLRDKTRDFRTVAVYATLLLDSYPMLEDGIDELEMLDYGEKDRLDIFISIAEIRLFERLLLPLGLIDMKTYKYPQENEFAKNALLDLLISEKNAINKELVLSKKLVKEFKDHIRTSHIEINLFEDLMFLFSQFSYLPIPPKQMVVENLMHKKPVIGTLKYSYERLYENMIESVCTTFDEFTQLDTAGGNRDDLVREYQNMLDALYSLVVTAKPFTTVQKLQILPAFIFDTLQIHYKIDITGQDFILQCAEVFDEEFAQDIGQLILLLNQLEKDAKKLKKSKPNFEQGVKELLQVYIMIVLELRSRLL